jgi:hypothetical protein
MCSGAPTPGSVPVFPPWPGFHIVTGLVVSKSSFWIDLYVGEPTPSVTSLGGGMTTTLDRDPIDGQKDGDR